jgi:putative addiction module component (TIGR02574 family)
VILAAASSINSDARRERISTTLEQLKTVIAELTLEEKTELANFLADSIDQGEGADGDVEAAWDHELARRADEIRGGTANGKPAEVVFAELREKYQ